MYWIEPMSCRVVAKETNQKLKGKIKYSNATKRVIGHYDRLITIHTHPYSSPPSIEDFNSNYWNHYDIGIVCCHNGKVFIYTAKELLIPKQFKLQMHEIIEMGYDEFDAQMMTLKKLQENHDITCLEV